MKTNGIDLTKYINLNFKAVVDGSIVSGKILPEAASHVRLDFGYRRVYLNDDALSRLIDRKSIELISSLISDFEIVPRDPETYRDWQVGDKVIMKYVGWNEQIEVIFRSGELVVCKDSDKNATETKTCEQLYREGGRLVLTDIEQQIIEGKKPKPHEFKKGEPVLVRSDRTHCWQLRAISLSVYGNPPKVEVTDGCDEWIYWIDKDEVIPYNERTMHLLGTNEDYKEE